MPVTFNRTNPAIARFQAGMQYGDQQRQAEEQAFEQRRQREQTLGVDRALREGISGIYAQPQSGAPAAPVAPAAQPPVQIAPTVAPDTAGMASPSVAPIAATGASPAPVAPAPARPAISSVTAGDPTRALMNRLSQTPGAGQVMMQEHGHEQTRQAQARTAERLGATQDRQARNEGWTQFNRHLDDFNIDAARQISTQYSLGIPDEAWNNIKFRNSMLLGAKLSKDMFKVSDELRPKFMHEFMTNVGNGKSEHESAIAAYGAVSQPDPNATPGTTGAKRLVKDASGKYVWVYEGGGSKPTNVSGSAPGARGGAAGGAGAGGGKQQQYAQWRIKTLTDAGVAAPEAARIVAGGGKQVGRRDVTGLASRLLSTKDRVGRPIYRDLQAAMTAAEQALGIEPMPGEAPTPAPAAAPLAAGPAPSAPAAPAAAPKPRLRYDANGNPVP